MTEEELKAIIADEHLHLHDRLEACLELGFYYKDDYKKAYKCFRLAQTLLITRG